MSSERDPVSLSRQPTTRFDDVLWLQAAQPLLKFPRDTALLVDLRTLASQDLVKWVAFYAAAEELGVKWGGRHGAIRYTEFYDGSTRVHVLSGHGRLALIAHDAPPSPALVDPIALCRALVTAPAVEEFSMPWAAVAYILDQLEDR